METGQASPLGLIAGQGALPIETARGMRAAGRHVVCAALAGQARLEELQPLCDRLAVVGLLRIGQWIRTLKRNGCREAVMVGRVGKAEMYERFHLFRYVPDWRARAGLTYRPNENWAYTVAARYSGKQYSTLDNTDIVPHVYGAFDNYVVIDLKVHYQATKAISFDVGIDNLLNEQYFLFHPFPGRTYVLAARGTF